MATSRPRATASKRLATADAAAGGGAAGAAGAIAIRTIKTVDRLAPEAERFGVPEEIDTTPVLGHAPGAPSAPVWSLQDDIPDTTPVADSASQGQSDKPVKKGWWQRAFSGDNSRSLLA